MHIAKELTMDIVKDIISKGSRERENHYNKLGEIFTSKPLPKGDEINETIESLTQIRYDKEYPNLVSKYPWLGRYSSSAIYVFFVTNFPYDLNKMVEIKEEVKTKKNISLFRINENSKEWTDVQKKDATVCLYVGSSKNIRTRLKEHLFSYNKKTYAMHLDQWFPQNLSIRIGTWDLGSFLENENQEYLQNIEDILWSFYQPLLGKQGKK